METWQAVDTIRVIREFTDQPVEEEQLNRILSAGRRAGSSKNLQRWIFIVVRDRKRLYRLSETGTFGSHIAGAAFAIALVTPDPHAADAPLSVVFDIGRAAQNMVLTAWDMGIGSCPATVYDHNLVRGVLALPDDQHCEYLLSFGHPANPDLLREPKRAGGRKELSDVVRYESWAAELNGNRSDE